MSNRLSAAANLAASGSPTDICTPAAPAGTFSAPTPTSTSSSLWPPSAGRSRGAQRRHHGPRRATSPAGPPPSLAPPHPHAPTFRTGARSPTLLLASRVSRALGRCRPLLGRLANCFISSSPSRPRLALWGAWFQTFLTPLGRYPPRPDCLPEVGPGPSSTASDLSPQ